jgi:ankyrin repeat protein
MKTKLGIIIFLLAATLAHAQTNNLTALLQQGLFEEQANRNLDAAIADYQSLARQFDKDRQLAATAVFRLGECYRMQGKTNEAALEYQRILRDFSDQTTLAALSRQNLAGLVSVPSPAAPSENSDAKLWDKVKNLPPDQLVKVLATLVPDAVLTKLLQQRDDAEAKLAELHMDYSTNYPDYQRQEAVLKTTERQISEKIDGMTQALKMRAELPQTTVAAATPSTDEDQEIARIQTMIQNSPDLINAPNGDGNTPLEKAAANGWLKVAAFLLDHGAEVNARGGMAFASAASAGNRAMVELLLSRGADVNAKGNNSDNRTPLHIAAQKGFQSVTEVLLANKAAVNARDSRGFTPLYLAVQRGQTNILQMLLAAGANVNVENSQGRTPLSYAAENGSLETVKMLLAAKADPNGGKLDAPLLTAIFQNNLALAETLLRAGADPNAVGDLDFLQSRTSLNYFNVNYMNHQHHVTPLWLAVYQQQLPMVQLLLKFKADPNDAQTDGRAVLFDALNHPEIVKTLLDAGTDLNARDETEPSFPGSAEYPRSTLLQKAASQNQPATVKLLLQHGANPNTPDEEGDTVLHYAALNLADEKAFTLLLDQKANPNVRDNSGRTPLDIVKQWLQNGGGLPARFVSLAARNTQAEKLIALLRQHGALDVLPDWDRITASRPSAKYSAAIFYKGTNDWNRFTLLELISRVYYSGGGKVPFPDFEHIVVIRSNPEGKPSKRIEIDLLNSTNGVDCSKDVTLEFGDTVEIPERGHTLAEKDTWTSEQIDRIFSFLRSKAGEAKLIVAGGQTIQLPLKDFEPEYCSIGDVLRSSIAQNVLTSDSDLSRIKVTRRDAKSGKKSEWILDCTGPTANATARTFAARIQIMAQNASEMSSDLWLRDGDVINVPGKP